MASDDWSSKDDNRANTANDDQVLQVETNPGTRSSGARKDQEERREQISNSQPSADHEGHLDHRGEESVAEGYRVRNDARVSHNNSNSRNSVTVTTHPPPRFNGYKTKLCGAFSRGVCINPDCTYAHGSEELRKLPDLRKTKLCVMFKVHGACPSRENCTYAHGPEELQPLPPNHYYNAPLRRPQQQGGGVSPKYYEQALYSRQLRPSLVALGGAVPQPPPNLKPSPNGSYSSSRFSLSRNNFKRVPAQCHTPPAARSNENVPTPSTIFEDENSYRHPAPPPPPFYPSTRTDLSSFQQKRVESDTNQHNDTINSSEPIKGTDDGFHQIESAQCEPHPPYYNNQATTTYIPVMLAPPAFAQSTTPGFQGPPPYPSQVPGGRLWFPAPPWMGPVISPEHQQYKTSPPNGTVNENDTESFGMPLPAGNNHGMGANNYRPGTYSPAYLQTMLYQHLMYAAGMGNTQDARYGQPPQIPAAFIPGAYPFQVASEEQGFSPTSTTFRQAQQASMVIERQEERKTSAPT